MKTTKKILALVAAVIASFAAFAANAFASSPCIGALYEPEIPEKLRDR
jgi:cyclic lactone autoinducer peptide